jgi:nitrate reductase NapE component
MSPRRKATSVGVTVRAESVVPSSGSSGVATPATQPAALPPALTDLVSVESGKKALRIEIQEKAKPWWQRNRFLLAGFLLLVLTVAVGGAWWFTVRPQRDQVTLTPPMPTLLVVLNHPSGLSLGDSGTLDIEVTNQGTAPLSGLKATVVFSQPLAVSLPVTGSTILDFGSMEVGEGKRRQLPFQLVQSGPLVFTLRLAPAGEQERFHGPHQIRFVPVPLLGTVVVLFIGILGGAGFLLWLLQKPLERLIAGRV